MLKNIRNFLKRNITAIQMGLLILGIVSFALLQFLNGFRLIEFETGMILTMMSLFFIILAPSIELLAG